uniref:Uncharacterized protein n=1 Tax=Periophthalmus magnuspinnatus TaxID=409849 RepID=A0A3B4API4_9GOBI
MSARTINLDTYSLSLLTAKEDIINPRSSINWALFIYDGISNKLRLAESGAGGVAELASKFHIAKPQYGLCRMGSPESGSPRTAMIIWMGQDVDDYRRTECATHIPAIKNFFKLYLYCHPLKQGTNYRKTNAAMEMRLANRDSFWARAERKEEERKRAAEERRRLERERALKEKQDEAAALVSQRTMNPREFFRQLSSSSSQSPTSPSRSGKPFRRYQRSLTDTAFIFSKAEENSATSPCSSPLVSPFSRAAPSSFNRATSPPTSPVFHSSTSPQRTTLSPPLSPLRPAPPSSVLPSVPLANIQVRGRARSPSEPTAPPASPTLPSTVGTSSDEAIPGLPPIVAEHNTFSFEQSVSPPAPRASLPDQAISGERRTTGRKNRVCEIKEDSVVQTVLVEEDEEEEEDVKEKEDTQPKTEPQPDPEESAEENETRTQLEQVETIEEEEVTEPEETSAEKEQDQTEKRVMEEVHGVMENTEDTEAEVKEAEEETEQIMEEEHVYVTSKEPEQQENEEMIAEDGPDESESNEPALLTQHEECSEIIGKLSTKRINLTLKQPGLEKCHLTSRFITVFTLQCMINQSSPCYFVVFYIEDESELSFELGDIIRDVEAVDKGWWRGWSQDGRQGLFPANYVETISPQ